MSAHRTVACAKSTKIINFFQRLASSYMVSMVNSSIKQINHGLKSDTHSLVIFRMWIAVNSECRAQAWERVTNRSEREIGEKWNGIKLGSIINFNGKAAQEMAMWKLSFSIEFQLNRIYSTSYWINVHTFTQFYVLIIIDLSIIYIFFSHFFICLGCQCWFSA